MSHLVETMAYANAVPWHGLGNNIDADSSIEEWQRIQSGLDSGEGQVPKEKGITFTEHDIRGKVATDMDDIFKANKLLGHSSIQMTEDRIKQRKTDVAEPLSRRKK